MFGKGKLWQNVTSFSLRKSTHMRHLRFRKHPSFWVLPKFENSKDFDLVELFHPLASFESASLPLSDNALGFYNSAKEVLNSLELRELEHV